MSDTAKTLGYQVLESVEADFGELTWTFRLASNNRVAAGNFAVVPVDQFMTLNNKVRHAEGLLRRYLAGERDATFKEHVEKFFDPEPLG